MSDSGERHLYEGLQELSHETDRKLLELQRWARVSFTLDVRSKIENAGFNDTLVLKHVPKYSRSNLVFPKYHLGQLTFSKNAGDIVRGEYSCPHSELQSVGHTLQDILSAFERPPDANPQRWKEEAFDGEEKPLVPVAVHGIDYFQQLSNGGKVLAAPALFTYRTNDPESRKLLEHITAQFLQ